MQEAEYILGDMVARVIVSCGDDGSGDSADADAGVRSKNGDGADKDQWQRWLIFGAVGMVEYWKIKKS